MNRIDLTATGWTPRRLLGKALGRAGVGALVVFLSAYGSIVLTRNAEHLSTFWFANAFLLALLLRHPARSWSAFLLGGFVGQAAAHVLVSDPALFTVSVSALNTTEVLAVAAALRHWVGRDLDITRLPHLGAFVLVAGILAPAADSTIAAASLAAMKHLPPAKIWIVWYPVNALGFLVFTPPLLMRGQAGLSGLMRSGRRLETVAWVSGLVAASAVAFCQNMYPLLFLPMAVLALVAVRLGPAGATLGIGFVAVSAAAATLNGYGPVMLASDDPTTRSFVLQGFIASLVLSNLPLTALLSNLSRLDGKAREANRRLIFAETMARMGHWRLDLVSEELTWSNGVYSVHGLDPASFSPTLRNALAVYHPDDHAKIADTVSTAIRTGQGYESSLRIIRHDGAIRDVVSRGLCETAPDGRVTALFGTIMDVTDLRQAERAAVQSEARYRLIADNTNDMITHMDLTGRRLFVSPGARELLGHEAESLVGTSPHQMVHPDDAAQLRSLFADLASGQVEQAVNVNRLRHRDGRWIWIEASLKLLRDADGQPSSVVGTIRDISERKMANEALRDSEARYRMLADNASDMITYSDLSGRRLFVSPGSLTLTGYSPEDLIGTERSAYVHPDDEPNLRRKLDDLVAGRTALVTNINRIRHKDGWWIWIEATVKLLRDASGEPTGLVSALRDITDRKLADEALRQSEKRYKLLAENSTDLIALQPSFTADRSYVSPSVVAMTGYLPDEFLALGPSSYIHPEDEDRVAAVFAALTASQPAATIQHRIRHKAGHWLWAETDYRLIDTDERRRTVLLRSRDVTVRHKAEKALAASEARYRVLAETTSDVITQLDLQLRREYVSPSCRTILGYEPEELVGVWPSARMHPEDAPPIVAVARRLAKGEMDGDRTTITYRSLHKDGHWVWLETVMTLVRDETTGAPRSVICSLRDISERQRVARHLERAKETAESAAVAKTEFVANMSHELRTPLAGIIGVHDLLRMDPGLNDPQRRLVNLAGDAGRSLLAIVNDVLDFSKMDAGQLALESVPFDLDHLLTGCCDLARQQLNGKPVAIALAREPGTLGRFVADPTRLRQIVLNLLTNAVKFTDEGQITLAALYREDSGTLRVDITDTGIGIPPERIGSLFERFTQADASTTRRYGGTGLGLAISKRLTDLMSGRIGADPVPAGGSTFWFELPLPRHHGGLAQAPEEAGHAPPMSGRRLLLAEDNAVNAEIIEAMLATRGYAVSLVPDGAAAVQVACAGTDPVDLILMDLQMPVMDGLSATAAIRTDEARSGRGRLPIVGLTANALAEDAAACLSAGMDAHVAKPIDWRALFGLLEALLGPGAHPSAVPEDVRDGPDVLDIAKLQELSELIGRDRLGSMLDRFLSDLRVRLAAVLSGDENEVSNAVHVLVSTAGQLGFGELGTLCAEADRQLRAGSGFHRTEELRGAAERAASAAARSGFAAVA